MYNVATHQGVRDKLIMALLKWRAALEPVGWLQQHIAGSTGEGATDAATEYTKAMRGIDVEMRLQVDLAAIDQMVA